ncbi:hypothetical protein [Hamadaea tsunoensis]|uniref:hypothetical protein n=1 Tax=Hamadaea tsunoensis TaxID=53368 RepID=UPI00041AC0AB|nr:hypothetical protein [Hamadaea tsunoensis]
MQAGAKRWAVVAATMLAVAVTAVSPAHATGGYGFNRVTSPGASSQGVGYGYGWVGLSGPGVNDPIVGNLFFYDNSAGNAADHMDIFNPGYTYPRGWAYGQFGGCAYAYTFLNFYLESGSPHNGNCTPSYAGMAKADLFCSSGDWLCPAYGAYQDTLRVTINQNCPAFGNVGAALFGPSRATASSPGYNPLGTIPVNWPFDVRYVTKNRQWIMGKVPGFQFSAPGAPAPDLNWVFVPRGCV